MRKLFIISLSIVTLVLTSVSFSQDLNPTLTIRYEDFINDLSPGVAIGLKLTIDDERYTGFEVNTDQDDFDTRLLIGWKWGVMGIGAKTVGVNVFPHYTFGVSYEILDGLSSNFEYVMTPDEAAGLNDHLRLSMSVSF